MNDRVVEAWVLALRSGEFKQGKYVLNSVHESEGVVDERFCCLGVLCKLYEEETGSLDHNLSIVSTSGSSKAVARSYDGQTYCLPEPVIRWAGMKTATGDLEKAPPEVLDPMKHKCVSFTKFNNSLVDFNDKGASFEELADIIEETKEYL